MLLAAKRLKYKYKDAFNSEKMLLTTESCSYQQKVGVSSRKDGLSIGKDGFSIEKLVLAGEKMPLSIEKILLATKRCPYRRKDVPVDLDLR